MSFIFVGTAYHQVYGVPLNLKSPIIKLGEKKKNPVTSIYETYANDVIGYSDPFDAFHINILENEVAFSEKLPVVETSNEKILQCEFIDDQTIYCTSHGDIYYNSPENETESNWSKLYYNEAYANTIKSLPPRRAGKLQPEYTRAVVSKEFESTEVGFVGRGVVPFVYSFLDKTVIWKAKNVSNDELDLEIPANDVDMVFMHKNFHLAAANAENKIRIYDVRSRRRKPITDVFLTEVAKFEKALLTRMTKSSCEKYLYVGNDRGSIYELDIRKNMGMTHKFKGVTTSIKDMKIEADHLVVASLDGFLRIYNTNTKEKEFERYLNIHPTVVKITSEGIRFSEDQIYKVEEVNLNEGEESGEEDKKPKKVKQIRKRNKVGLKYLETNFSANDVKLENEGEIEIEEEQQKKEEERIKNEADLDEDLDL